MTTPLRTTVERNIEGVESRLVSERVAINIFEAADTTPSVLNTRVWKAGNTVANNVTFFDDGFDGQEILVLGDGFTTVVHNVVLLKTNTAANKLLAAGKVYRFTRFDSIWVEDA